MKYKCLYCKVEFDGGGDRKFCSCSCSVSYNNQFRNQLGSNNPNWKGGTRKSYKESNPERVKANNIISDLLRYRKIKPKPCEICKSIWMTQAHHQDYSEPLKVNWLCSACHMKVHFAVRTIKELAV